MKFWKLTALLAFTAIFFVACEEDDTTSPQPEANGSEYFPAEAGNYWIYENHEVTSEGVDETVLTVDSAYVTDVVENETTDIIDYTITSILDVDGEQEESVTLFKLKEEHILQADMTYLFSAANNGVLNMIKESIGSFLGSYGFVQIGDFEANEPWTLLPEYTMDSMTIADFLVEDIKYVIEGNRETAETITINGTDYDCQIMSVTHVMTGKTVYLQQEVDASVEIETKNYYGKGIGLVKVESAPAKVYATVFNQKVELPLGDQLGTGSEKIYVRGSH